MAQTTSYTVHAGSELAIRTEESSVSIVARDDGCEAFGAAIVRDKEYTISQNRSFSIYANRTAQIQVKGKPKECFVEPTDAWKSYQLINVRLTAQQTDSFGPRVIIIGPMDHGKSTLCTYLINRAVADGYTPLFIDLDVGQGVITTPGTISANVMKKQIGIEDCDDQYEDPLVLYFGFVEPAKNLDRLNLLLQHLQQIVDEKMAKDQRLKYSGCIINTCGHVEDKGFDLQVSSIQTLACNFVINMGKSSLTHNLLPILKAAPPPSYSITPRVAALLAAARARYDAANGIRAAALAPPQLSASDAAAAAGGVGAGAGFSTRAPPADELGRVSVAVRYAQQECDIVAAAASANLFTRQPELRRALRSERFKNYFYGTALQLTTYNITLAFQHAEVWEVKKEIPLYTTPFADPNALMQSVRFVQQKAPAQFQSLANRVAAVVLAPDLPPQKSTGSGSSSSSTSSSSSSSSASSSSSSSSSSEAAAPDVNTPIPLPDIEFPAAMQPLSRQRTLQSLRGVVGLVCIQEVIMSQQRMMILSPAPAPLPSFGTPPKVVLLVGDLTWVDPVRAERRTQEGLVTQ